MDLNWLEDFIALAETENFSRAADARHVSQPAFSRRVRALENWVGTPLFNRATHRISLTDAGQQFLASASETIRLLRHAREIAREAGGVEAGMLRFATTHSLSFNFLPEWLRSIGPEATVYNIRITSSSIRACEQMLVDGQAQFLLCHSHPDAPSRLAGGRHLSYLVGHDMLVLTAGCELAARGRDAIAHAPQLAYNEESGLGRIIAATGAWDRHVQSHSPVFASHLAAVLRSMVCNNRGIAWLPLSLIGDDVKEQRLTIVSATDEQINVDIRLFRSRTRQTASAEAFWSLVGDAAESYAAAGPGTNG